MVKAFSIYGFENLKNNQISDYNLKPAMFFCGDDARFKSTVSALIASLDWEPLDVGVLKQALHLEHMTLMWVRMIRMWVNKPQSGMGSHAEVSAMKTVLITGGTSGIGLELVKYFDKGNYQVFFTTRIRQRML